MLQQKPQRCHSQCEMLCASHVATRCMFALFPETYFELSWDNFVWLEAIFSSLCVPPSQGMIFSMTASGAVSNES